MGRRLRAPVAVALIAASFAIAACGGDANSGAGTAPNATQGDRAYIARANAICRHGVREARRIGARAGTVDPGDVDTITAIFVRPGISLLERQAARMRRLKAPASATDFRTYVGLYDPATVLTEQRVQAALAHKPARLQQLAAAMDQLSADSRAAARAAGLDDCDVDIARQIVLAASGK